MSTTSVDSATKEWTLNAADELAAAQGCRFDEERARFVVGWIERYCYLYEGEWAGEPVKLRDWALECTMRLFGWVKWSDKWGREVRRHREASIWVAKKNKKSPTLAAWGMYLLVGDGERGQKVFLAAKDGSQAREIAGKHAVEMLRQSPELQAECTLNQSTMQITHEPTRSLMKPLSSANSRTKESKEGLNGSVLIDETHVVDRDYINRISRAGISRSEPLQIEVSTAGNDPDGYGKERFDYAREVERGTIQDTRIMVAVYAAPTDLSDADLEADPLKYGRIANPAIGHTVDPDEYLADYERSKRSLAKLSDFKMYRLNIWQKSSNPWLRYSDWEACGADYTEDDLAGRTCFAGLDLSRTRDMSSLVLAFPDDDQHESFTLLPYFWLPEKVARDNDHIASFGEWARGGHLELTPGAVVDFTLIRRKFRALAKLFNIIELAYDPKFAEETTQYLEQGIAAEGGGYVEEPTGVTRFVFRQQMLEFAKPTSQFERLVIAAHLRHNRHPVLSWQIAHAETVSDTNSKNKRVVKPKASGLKTVDGVVAAIMAIGRAMESEGEPRSVYDSGPIKMV